MVRVKVRVSARIKVRLTLQTPYVSCVAPRLRHAPYRPHSYTSLTGAPHRPVPNLAGGLVRPGRVANAVWHLGLLVAHRDGVDGQVWRLLFVVGVCVCCWGVCCVDGLVGGDLVGHGGDQHAAIGDRQSGCGVCAWLGPFRSF